MAKAYKSEMVGDHLELRGPKRWVEHVIRVAKSGVKVRAEREA